MPDPGRRRALVGPPRPPWPGRTRCRSLSYPLAPYEHAAPSERLVARIPPVDAILPGEHHPGSGSAPPGPYILTCAEPRLHGPHDLRDPPVHAGRLASAARRAAG